MIATMRMMRVVLVVLAGLTLQACATSSTTVLATASVSLRNTVDKITIEQGENTVSVPVDAVAYFDERLRDNLFKPGSRFSQGEGVTLRYRFIKMDEGDRALRYIIGFGAGKGEMTIEVVYLDGSGKELARAEFDGEISVGVLGGDFDEAISATAREVSDYTVANF